MLFYGEESMAMDGEPVKCKSCKHRGDTPHCLSCQFHEWNKEYRGKEKEFGLSDLYEDKDKKD